jgi:RimJ/RimL family protein N-acetyltransferase
VRGRLTIELQNQSEYQVQYWPLFLLANDDHVGCCGLRPYRVEERVFEAGVHLKTAYRRQGYALEAAYAVIDYAFTVLNVKGLFAGHNPANQASRRLLEKLGFRFTHTEFYLPTGLQHPSYLLSREDYDATR